MGVTVKTNIGSMSAFADRLAEMARPQAQRLLNDVGRDAVARCNAIVAREFNNSRPPERRRPGAKLLGSFTASATRGSGRVLATMRLSTNAPAVKVLALDHGSNPHPIGTPGSVVAFPPGNAFISGKGKKLGAASFRRRQSSPSATGKGGNIVRPAPVMHPGTEGSMFMERALEQAIQNVLRRSVRIARR